MLPKIMAFIFVRKDGDTNDYNETTDFTEDKGLLNDTSFAIEVVNEKPTIEKQVKDGDVYDEDTTASIGDELEWKVTVGVPSNVDQLCTFMITDNMSAELDYVKPAEASGLTIKAYKADKTEVTVDSSWYTPLEPNNGAAKGVWTITFNSTGKKALVANEVQTIEVTFKTILNAAAKTGKTGNENSSTLTYSNSTVTDIDNVPAGQEPKEDTIEDKAVVYTFVLDLLKVDGNTNSTVLPGVEFNLYSYSGDTEKVTETVLKENGKRIAVTNKDDTSSGAYVVDIRKSRK